MPGLESLFWRGIRMQRRRGEEKNQVPKVCFFWIWARETRQHRQDKPTQAKGSRRGWMTFSESGWYLAEAVGVSLGDHARGRLSLESSAVHNRSFGK